ncbi:fluoride efflux transporter FluC [Gordonia shandongensis]|uniref:fluoride efflux transporter FluC n=1 Tax=Gordonia shandongensis TaxID=376351 RepID=UPI000414915B|nr:CrcB family protein [Gordonia shandongensis]
MILALTVVAGACGAVARYLVDYLLGRRWPDAFPGPTVLINVTGCLLIGVVAGAVIATGAGADWQTVVGTGFCGGYTTFSTASVETVRSGGGRRAVTYAGVTLVGSVAACAVGVWLGSLI